jgi:hypothetical protein
MERESWRNKRTLPVNNVLYCKSHDTFFEVTNIDLELDELLHAPGGHCRISVASRTIPLQGLRRISSVTASMPKIYSARLKVSFQTARTATKCNHVTCGTLR